MTTEEIIKGLKKKDIVYVGVDRYSIKGVVKDICYVEPLNEDGYYSIQLYFNNQIIYFDTRSDVEILRWIRKEGNEYVEYYDTDRRKAVLEKYDIDKDSSFAEIIGSIIDKWNDLTEEERDEILEGLEGFEFKEMMKDIIGALEIYKESRDKLSDWKITKLDKELEFLSNYREFKSTLPDSISKLYDYIIFNICGLELN